MDLHKVTRVEVIDSKGRSYVNWDCDKVIASLQDDDRTLKLFISEGITLCKNCNCMTQDIIDGKVIRCGKCSATKGFKHV